MDQIAQLPGMMGAGVVFVVEHREVVLQRHIAPETLCYIGFLVAAGSPVDTNFGIEPDKQLAGVAFVEVLVRIQMHLPGQQAVGQTHSRAGTVVQAGVAVGSLQPPRSYTVLLVAL